MSQEISALTELKGRLTFIQVQYLDTGPGIRPALECIDWIINQAVKGPITNFQTEELADKLGDVRAYLAWIIGEYPETTKDVSPAINIINWLMEPVTGQTQH